jgi:hypothetical protein
MRTIILLFAFTIFSTNRCISQFCSPFPETPFTGEFSDKRVLADTVSVSTREYEMDGKEIVTPTIKTVIKHNENGLSDTIFILSGVIYADIRNYSPTGQVISILEGGFAGHSDVFFDYTPDGRISKIESKDMETKRYDYDKNIIIRNENRARIDTLFIEYTENGYIVSEKNKKTSYIFDNDNRLIQAGDIYYEYSDDGYTMTDSKIKVVYQLNKDGFLTKLTNYKYVESKWVIQAVSDYEYKIKSDIPSSTMIQEASDIEIYGLQDALLIKSSKNRSVKIYSINGKLFYSGMVLSYKKIPMPKGIYIVLINNKSYKHIVK